MLVAAARRLLGLTQRELGERLGSSRRTVLRWESGSSWPMPQQLQQLAGLVHPLDAALADQVAFAGGTTLEALGIGAQPAPEVTRVVAPAPAPAALPTPPALPIGPRIDAVVLAVAEVLEGLGVAAATRTARAVVTTAFGRARELGLGSEEVAEGMKGAERKVRARP